MSAEHTPGPWLTKHRAGSDGMYRTEVYSAEHGGIATCDWTPKHCGNGVTESYREANARLIACAPDLLAALTALASIDDGDEPAFWKHEAVFNAAWAAIEKATGEAQ